MKAALLHIALIGLALAWLFMVAMAARVAYFSWRLYRDGRRNEAADHS